MNGFSSRIIKSALLLGLIAIAATSPEAFAQTSISSDGQTVGDIAGNITNSLQDVSKLAEAIAWVAGFFMGLGALFKFKAYRDNPQQTPLGTPITWLAIAVFLIFLPELFGSGAQTIWGGDANQVQPW